ncbi:MAG: amidohydrolase family protein [bacterium]|nr:amidohydrolase family protein [bacterium]
MIIDGHAHACGDYLTPESIIKNLDRVGANKVILVPGEFNSDTTYGIPNLAELFPKKNVVKIFNALAKLVIKLTGAVKEIPPGNDYVFDLSANCQGRVIQFIWITTGISNPVDYLNKKYSDWNFKGVKMHQCWEKFSVDSDFFRSVAGWAESKGLPLFFHPWSNAEVKKLINYKKQHKDLTLIVAHLFGLELFIEEDYKDNKLFFDISSLQFTSNYRVLKAIEFYGADKVLLGTDTPYGKNNLQKNVDRINKLEINNEDKELILGENMKKLLQL